MIHCRLTFYIPIQLVIKVHQYISKGYKFNQPNFESQIHIFLLCYTKTEVTLFISDLYDFFLKILYFLNTLLSK